MAFFNVLFKTLGFLSAILLFIIVINILLYFSNNLEQNQFKMIEGDINSKNVISKINLNGPIFNDSNNLFGNNFYNYIDPRVVKGYLNDLKKIETKILIININSPGGTVSATAELEKIFNSYKKETNNKIYFFTNEILASGGYWVATSGHKIFASYGSIIGSIGVSGPNWYYYDNPISFSSGILGEKIETKNGIEVYSQNIGKGKDLFNPFRKPKIEEIEHLENIINDIYVDFVTKVSKSRKVDVSYVKDNIGALIFNSKQAKDNFLIDDILDIDQLIELLIKENNYENYKIYENNNQPTLIENLLLNHKVNNFEKSYTNFCTKLDTTINVLTPLFLKKC